MGCLGSASSVANSISCPSDVTALNLCNFALGLGESVVLRRVGMLKHNLTFLVIIRRVFL